MRCFCCRPSFSSWALAVERSPCKNWKLSEVGDSPKLAESFTEFREKKEVEGCETGSERGSYGRFHLCGFFQAESF